MADETYDLFARRERRVYKVLELTRELKGLVEGRFPAVHVEGEISNFRRNAASGHCYFTLKDAGASLRCVLFRNQARLLRFEAADGQHVLAKGRLSVYEAGGEYNLACDTLEPVGAGALALKFDALKKRLEAEGLFDAEVKRPLPLIPRRIGVVTSPTGAAVADFLRVLHGRWPDVPVLVVPARVQGAEAAPEICRGLQRLGAVPDVDVVVVTRGGGSLEDLWAFNEEAVARAIRRCPVPVVSAVGHEVDFTISDFAADARAPTPSAAAQLVVPVKDDLRRELSVWRGRLERGVRRHVEVRRGRLGAARGLLSDPRRVIGERRMALDRLFARAEREVRDRVREGRQGLARTEQALQRGHPRARLSALAAELARLEQRMQRGVAGRLNGERQGLGAMAARLDALSPLKVLSRGYALAFDAGGRLVREADALRPGDVVRVQVSEGSFDARVERVDGPRSGE